MKLRTLVFEGNVEELKAELARLGHRTDLFVTPLGHAVFLGRIDCVRVLLDAGVDVNAQDSSYARPPVAMCAANGYLEIGKLLLERGAILRRAQVKKAIWPYSPVFDYRDQLGRCRMAQRAVMRLCRRHQFLRDLAQQIADLVWATRGHEAWLPSRWWRPRIYAALGDQGPQ